MQYKALESTFYFHFGLNDNTGAGADGASPAFHARLCGAAASAAPVYSGTPTLLTHANYPAGCFEIVIPATTANGFITDNQYAVFCTALVSAVNPTGFVGEFTTTALMNDTDVDDVLNANTDINTLITNIATIISKLPSNYVMGSSDMDNHDTDIDTLLSRIVGTLATGTHNPQSGDAYALIGAAGAGLTAITQYIDTEIQSIITHLTDIKGVGWTTQTLQAIVTAIGTKPSVADVNAQCDIAIADAALSSQTSVNTIDGIVDSLLIIAQKLDTMLELDGAIYKFTFNALEEAPTGSGGFTVDDRNDLQAIDAISTILASMYENSAGYRWKTKALEQGPVTSIATLATSAALAAVDTKIDTIDSNVDSVLEDTGSTGVKVVDVETGLTHAHAMQILVALGCLMDGGGTATIHARNYADSKNRVTWVVDANGNRTGITFNFD